MTTIPGSTNPSISRNIPSPERKPNPGNNRYALQDFFNKTKQRDLKEGVFELESDRILEINLNGPVWIKTGSMIGYLGNITFVRERILEFGFKKALKKFFTGEGASLTQASGRGKLYIADQSKKISLITLQGETIYINGNDILAFEKSLTWDVTFLRKLGALVSGGLFNVKFSGQGTIAISTHYDPLTLEVTPGNPVVTDPSATVAWSGSLTPEFRVDVQLKTFFGRGSGESIQSVFKGNGYVLIQPYEEAPVAVNAPQGSTGQAKGIIGVIVVVLYVVAAIVVKIFGGK